MPCPTIDPMLAGMSRCDISASAPIAVADNDTAIDISHANIAITRTRREDWNLRMENRGDMRTSLSSSDHLTQWVIEWRRRGQDAHAVTIDHGAYSRCVHHMHARHLPRTGCGTGGMVICAAAHAMPHPHGKESERLLTPAVVICLASGN